ncbi:glycoside hydrolase family 3 N-terminal domain-containing protein [Occultella gossypii]|uniref:Glycoside hydrolase family 3 protein n=1 Tax=Occultella gossypii TaxID=2800820 RepID=A0ABS7SCD6_9MICO|nr:glycoside hydrolase family 3 N-terminal domain-containing protein [Occultella gossypii]MBZ2197410.1 glycoside hydrolase family 3 protein [Occultella gossypii]
MRHHRGSDRSLESLAHSVLWPGFTGTRAPDWLLRARDAGAPGALLFAHNIDPDDADQLSRLVGELDGTRGSLVGADEEGGLVTRLHARDGSPSPGHAVLGRHDVIADTETVAEQIGAELARHGIAIDLAPVADVNNNPANPVIGSRSFGADPELVARHAAAYVRGLQRAGTAACAKHFPGHGDTTTDSHLAVSRMEVSADELEEIHLAPFRAAIEAGVRSVLTAHIIVPVLGPEPATVNPRALSMLRGMGFDGLIISDAVEMEAIASTLGIGPGAVAALAAGVDLVCLGNQGADPRTPENPRPDESAYRTVHTAVVDALRSGSLRAERLEEAAERIAALRTWVTAHRTGGSPDLASTTSTPDTPTAARNAPTTTAVRVAAHACDVRGDVRLRAGVPVTVIDARVLRNRAAGREADLVGRALAARRAISHHRFDGDDTAELLRADPQGEVVLVVDQPHIAAAERHALTDVLAWHPDTVVVRLGWPGDLGVDLPRLVTTHGSSAVSASAVADLLLG